MTVTSIIGWILLISTIIIVFYILACIARALLLCHARRCKYCDHTMTFKRKMVGVVETIYVFHCDHCGAWERVTKEELLGRKEDDRYE